MSTSPHDRARQLPSLPTHSDRAEGPGPVTLSQPAYGHGGNARTDERGNKMSDVHEHRDNESTGDQRPAHEDARETDAVHKVTIWIGGVKRELGGDRQRG